MLFFLNLHTLSLLVQGMQNISGFVTLARCGTTNGSVMRVQADKSRNWNGFDPGTRVSSAVGKKLFKMVYLIGPDGFINRTFANFHKIVWMTMVHVLRFRIKHQKSPGIQGCPFSGNIIHIHAVFFKFAYPQFTSTGYAEYIRFCHTCKVSKRTQTQVLLWLK